MSKEDLWYWPEGSNPSFVSETGEDGSWEPLCDRLTASGEPVHTEPTKMVYRSTSGSNYDCPGCGTRHLIWAEDWPDYNEEDDDLP